MNPLPSIKFQCQPGGKLPCRRGVLRDFKWARGIIRFMSMCEVLPFTKARRGAERACSRARLNRDIAVISRGTIDSSRANSSGTPKFIDPAIYEIEVLNWKSDRRQLLEDIVSSLIYPEN